MPEVDSRLRRRALAVLLLVGLCTAVFALPVSAQMGGAEIRGRAPQALDSGLLDFAGKPVYLYGLRGARPERTCLLRDGSSWNCGQEARWAARNRIANHWVECVERGRGPGGEIFALCYLGGVGGPELNAWLVEQGWAMAARDYADDYVAAEERARAAGLGLWRGQ